MKTFHLIFTGLFFLYSCYSQKVRNNNGGICNENLQFKKAFFEKIDTIQNLVTKNQDAQFWHSLAFISKYTKVSYEDTLNYARTYPYSTFLRDKANWLEWYKGNKCTNIQFK